MTDLNELERQIDRLANFIMHEIEGEPSESQGAVDTAIRIMEKQAREADELRAENERLREGLTGIVEFGERHPGHGYSCAILARAALGEAK